MAEILLSLDKYRCTFFHLAAECRSSTAIKLILEANLPSDVLKQLFVAKNKWSQTVLHRAPGNSCRTDMLEILLGFIVHKSNLSLEG